MIVWIPPPSNVSEVKKTWLLFLLKTQCRRSHDNWFKWSKKTWMWMIVLIPPWLRPYWQQSSVLPTPSSSQPLWHKNIGVCSNWYMCFHDLKNSQQFGVLQLIQFNFMTPFDKTVHITQKTVVTNLWCTLEWHPSVIEGESGRFINHVPNMGELIMKHRKEGAVVSFRAFLFNISCAQELSWIECYILATVVKNTKAGWIGVMRTDQRLSWE